MAEPEINDLLIICDATFSMGDYLTALRDALPKIIAVSSLTDSFSRIGLLAYRDYCDTKLLEWSGWLDQSSSESEVSAQNLLNMASTLDSIGGGDFPEALKTALARGYELMREEASTLILLYTDAAPHTVANGDKRDTSSNYLPEQKALLKPDAYGGFGPTFADWISGSKLFHSGPKKAHVFPFIEKSSVGLLAAYYQYIAYASKGMCVYMGNPKPADISDATIEILLAWMRVFKAGADDAKPLKGSLARFIKVGEWKNVKNEDAAHKLELFDRRTATFNTAEVTLSTNMLKKHLPKRAQPVQDFAKRYAQDDAYKSVVVRELSNIIERDVSAIAVNPVFGSLWRAVCNDRGNEHRDRLITAFGHQVEQLKNQEDKTRKKLWLEESYDYTAEVLDTIARVPTEEQYPCVMLDPTLAFTKTSNDDDQDEDEDDRAITDFRRDELLEIGRSCDYRILRRLGKVLTRLTYVSSADELPAHLANASSEEVTKLPMALAKKSYDRKFWRILLHLVVPGTMLGARAAAVLAALTLRLGVEPLARPAIQELSLWRDRWNNLEVPETWNVSCLSLLLDADKIYRSMLKSGDVKNPDESLPSLLTEDDRKLFDRVVSYKMLELNLNTDLTAKVSWTPNKTTLPIGPLVTCRVCKYPRSVTMMGPQGRCGMCLVPEWKSPKIKEDTIKHRVTKEDNAATEACWVKCGTDSCRAQYILYSPQDLNIKPRCHYCRYKLDPERNAGPAPLVECRQCLSRMIWPDEYRNGMDPADFLCVGCQHNRATIVDETTTAKSLAAENGTSWLLKNDRRKIKEPFTNRSVFHTISTAGTSNFTTLVHILPTPSQSHPLTLTLHGAPIQNLPSLLSQLHTWISRRRTQSATCSLCFSTHRKDSLRPACARRGCLQRICPPCLQAWYGLNGLGRIINVSALSCPFCRRAPAARTLAAYGMGVHALANLHNAVREHGAWVYAWCRVCNAAKRFVERVCAAGAPPDMSDFRCEPCAEKFDRIVTAKECPGCGVMTSKTAGCDHMACRCGAHWCYRCGEEKGAREIYRHMSEVHGGWFWGGEDGGGTDEEEEEDEREDGGWVHRGRGG